MAKKRLFGLDPKKLDKILSIGTENADGSDIEDKKLPTTSEDTSAKRIDAPSPTASLEIFAEKLGSQIGRYKLLHVLGEGGMGIVYLAEQERPIKRRVALKIIKPGMDSKRVIARFEAERQALALLDHSNIAHVHDAGTTESGRPYFVMEYVKGLPITEHCDRHRLTIEDRLNLFRKICLAVHHAHQKGIIHRDIKPSNILVSLQDDQAVPKIIDFGVAKAIAHPLTERTLATEESQLLGTPEYMSPEQADMATEDIDTRSDIYSLGVLLYVLLSGALPFDSETLRTGGIEHIRQIIRETDPKTPSTRLTKLGEEAQKVAENRRTEIGTLAKCLHKELEWIPLKAMRKERSERYRSASELADDIENYLNGEPLMAGPLGTGYKLRKFVRRNRVLVGGVVAVLVVLIVGIVVSTILAIGQARARIEAQLIADFLENDVLGSASRARIGEATAIYMLDAASKRLEGKFEEKPLIEASIREKLGWTYRYIGEPEKAEQHFLRAIEIYQKHFGEDHPDTLRATTDIGWVYEDQGRYHDMERLWIKNLKIRQRVSGVEDQINTMNALAAAYDHLGKYSEAEALFKEILQFVKRRLVREDFRLLVFVRCNLACVYAHQGRYKESEQLFMNTLKTAEWPEEYANWEFEYATELANMYTEQGQYNKAEPLFDKALGTQRLMVGNEHPSTLMCVYYFARLYTDQGHYEKADNLLNEALQIARRRFREEHPLTLRLLNAIAALHTNQKQYGQAERLFDEALKGRRRELGDDHPETLETINDLGILHRQWKHYKQAEKLLTEALEKRKIKLGDDHPHTLQSEHELALLYKEQGEYDKAEPFLVEAVEGRRLKLGDTHPHTLESWNNLIELYEAWNKPEKAKEWRAKLQQNSK
jgi:serine/threonine protein kinase/Tfp pilus assembly protein PilF